MQYVLERIRGERHRLGLTRAEEVDNECTSGLCSEVTPVHERTDYREAGVRVYRVCKPLSRCAIDDEPSAVQLDAVGAQPTDSFQICQCRR